MDIRNNRGVVMISAYAAVVVLMMLGSVFFWRAYNENNLALRYRLSTEALSIAEAGIERAIYNLQNDFANYPTPSWLDGFIDNIPCTPPGPLYTDIAFGNGSYSVGLTNVGGRIDHMRVLSTGTVEGIMRNIEVYIKMEEVNIWNNAIFAGIGSPAGVLINGNVDIRGSIHLLGDGLTFADIAMDMSGSGHIGNNYDGIPASFLNRLPALETTIVGGEVVETMNAKLRVKRGKVGLSGSAQVGDEDEPGDVYKETVDGVYVTDGYAGNQGDTNIFSDNGTRNRYDLGDRLELPSLSDPFLGYDSYMEYLKANALVIDQPVDLAVLANIKPTASFSFTDPGPIPKGSISMDGSGNLFIDGIVYVDGGDVNMSKDKNFKTIEYVGRGSLVVTGDVSMNVNLLTAGAYPANIIGVMTPGEIDFGGANYDVMGIFYGETQVTSTMQTDVAGTFVSNSFDMGQQVPKIFQVPEIVRNLPPGTIGSDSIWLSVIVAWREV
ncbi:MAG: hypothetical protein ABH843_04930 [Candidatus Omnitrophota bacterium]